MNFFEHQERARRNTGRLVLLMAGAVVSLILITSVILIALSANQGIGYNNQSPWETVLSVALLISSVVVVGSLYKLLTLRQGGKVIAERLGGRLINLEPHDFAERRALNVVEEMAIASGSPVPSVYVLDDDAINAFAAGLTPQDAVIGLTRGAVELLSRDELQGVVAHEFSHIYNGDMRLNTRLIAVLHGILLLGLIGALVLRGALTSSRSRSSSDRNNNASAALALAAIGASLMALGYAGTFFGNLIKAAVSRQREFLADASAVQFTRNPQSIAGALKKIGGYELGSELQTPHAAEFSHMYFGAGVSTALDGMMATHPPLHERILRVDPSWNGEFPEVDPELPFEPQSEQSGTTPSPAPLVFNLAAIEHAIATIGEPSAAHLQQARSALGTLPPALIDAAHQSLGAQALVYGLLLDSIPALADEQLTRLRRDAEPAVLDHLEALREPLQALDPHLRLTLIDVAIPALKALSKPAFAIFKANLKGLILADDRIDLMEWTLLRLIELHVEGTPAVTGKYSLEQLPDEVARLLSTLACAGSDDPVQVLQAFEYACRDLPVTGLTLRTSDDDEWTALEVALNRLRQLQPLAKPVLLKAMARCIEQDGDVTPAEGELIRAVADMLDCPMPPLLTQPAHGDDSRA